MALILNGDTGITYPVATATGSATQASAGRVLQVVSTNLATTFSSTATTFSDITGLSVSITPSSSSSKVFVTVDMTGQGVNAVNQSQFRLLRDSTVIDAGAAAGAQSLGFAGALPADNNCPVTFGASFLDSPATTSSTTYKVQCRTSAGGTTYVNFCQGDGSDVNRIRTASTITVMEISA
jgi:hypothetical protein